MLKYALLATALTFGLSAPSYAAGGCEDSAAWNKMEQDINAMKDGPDKDATMAEWKLSVKAKADKNMNECDSHMKAAGERRGKAG